MELQVDREIFSSWWIIQHFSKQPQITTRQDSCRKLKRSPLSRKEGFMMKENCYTQWSQLLTLTSWSPRKHQFPPSWNLPSWKEEEGGRGREICEVNKPHKFQKTKTYKIQEAPFQGYRSKNNCCREEMLQSTQFPGGDSTSPDAGKLQRDLQGWRFVGHHPHWSEDIWWCNCL